MENVAVIAKSYSGRRRNFRDIDVFININNIFSFWVDLNSENSVNRYFIYRI